MFPPLGGGKVNPFLSLLLIKFLTVVVSLLLNLILIRPLSHIKQILILTTLINHIGLLFLSCVTNDSSSPKNILISNNNSLPSMSLHLGIQEDDENQIGMLVDIWAVILTSNLQYQMWAMSQ